MIARVLRELGYMREMGEGVSRMFYTIHPFELVDPEFTGEADYFSVTCTISPCFRQKIWSGSRASGEVFGLTKNEQRIVLLGRDSHLLSTKEIIKATGIVDTEDFRALYESMRRKGIIYNAKPGMSVGAGRRREVGRFRVRPPQQAQQYLDELLLAFGKVGQVSELPSGSEKSIRTALSPNSPYSEKPLSSLQALGFLDAQRKLLPKLRVLSARPQPEDLSSWKRGKLKTKRPEGYGFIRGYDDNEYYLHASSVLAPYTFDLLKEGMDLLFKVGERHIPGKPRPAMQVKVPIEERSV